MARGSLLKYNKPVLIFILMKKLIVFIVSLFILSACATTRVYPGQQEGRDYINQSARACETLVFSCPEGKQVFSDETGCGCETKPAEEAVPAEEEQPAVTEPEEVTPPAEEPATEEPEETPPEEEPAVEPPAEEPPAEQPEETPPSEEPAPPAEEPAPETPPAETEPEV